MLPETAKPAPVPGFDLEQLGEEVVIYHPLSEAIFYCNATAALVFRLCDGQRSILDIVRLLSEAYPEARAQLSGDVHQTLERLMAHGAIVLS
jgi:hypothetical protein